MSLFDFSNGGTAKGNSTTGGLFTHLLDSIGNYISQVHRAKIPATQEGILVMGKNDDFATLLRTDRKGNLITGNYNLDLIEAFEGATLNVQKWTATSSTFAPTQATLLGYQHNPANSVLSGAGTMLVSQRLMYKLPRNPLQIKRRFRHSMVANSVTDFGWGAPSALTTLIVPNGAQLRISSSGTLVAYITFNGAEIATANVIAKSTLGGNTIGANLTMASLTANYYTYDLIVDDDNLVVTIQDTETGNMIGSCSIPVPATVLKMWGATALPYYERTYNTGTPASAPTVITADITCLNTDMNIQLDASQYAGNIGMSAGRNPFTGAQTENHTNSTAPVSGTLSNTAGAYTTLGGRFQFVATAGAVTDYALFAFTVPTGSKFLCEGIHIELYNTVVAVATTPTIFEWAMGFNSSAVSLATANIIRRQVGAQNFQIGAGVGACATPLDVNFITPEVVESGRFVHVILNMPVGTATATEIFRGTCLIKGRFI